MNGAFKNHSTPRKFSKLPGSIFVERKNFDFEEKVFPPVNKELKTKKEEIKAFKTAIFEKLNPNWNASVNVNPQSINYKTQSNENRATTVTISSKPASRRILPGSDISNILNITSLSQSINLNETSDKLASPKSILDTPNSHLKPRSSTNGVSQSVMSPVFSPRSASSTIRILRKRPSSYRNPATPNKLNFSNSSNSSSPDGSEIIKNTQTETSSINKTISKSFSLHELNNQINENELNTTPIISSTPENLNNTKTSSTSSIRRFTVMNSPSIESIHNALNLHKELHFTGRRKSLSVSNISFGDSTLNRPNSARYRNDHNNSFQSPTSRSQSRPQSARTYTPKTPNSNQSYSNDEDKPNWNSSTIYDNTSKIEQIQTPRRNLFNSTEKHTYRSPFINNTANSASTPKSIQSSNRFLNQNRSEIEENDDFLKEINTESSIQIKKKVYQSPFKRASNVLHSKRIEKREKKDSILRIQAFGKKCADILEGVKHNQNNSYDNLNNEDEELNSKFNISYNGGLEETIENNNPPLHRSKAPSPLSQTTPIN